VAPVPSPAKPAVAAPASARKQAISLTIPPALLVRVDEAAGRLGLSRAAAIALALSRFVDGEDAR
jgi:metal-responsive CopG/Arc/MetJ family transcriptional regulator